MSHHTCHKFLCAQNICNGFQRPCEGQDQDRRNHCLKTCRHTFHAFLEGQGTAAQVINQGDNQCHETSHGKSHGRVTVGERFDYRYTVKDTAGIEHPDDTADDQHDNREKHVHHVAAFRIFCLNFFEFLLACGKQVAFDGIILMQTHRTIVKSPQGDGNHHNDCQQCIVVVRNCGYKQAESVFSLYKTGNCRCPGRNRGNDAYRCCCGVNQICQLCSGYLVFIRNRTHNRSYRQAVKIVINKDQAAQKHGGQLRADPGLYLL